MARVVFIGSKDLGHRLLESLIGSLPEPHRLAAILVPDDRDDPRSAMTALEETAAGAGVAFSVAAGSAEAMAAVERAAADVVIVCGWYSLLPVDRAPSVAFYGIHAGPLPRYRGHAPVVWQIIDGRDEIGVTLFRMDMGMDSGPIVRQGSIPLGRDQTVADALRGISDLSARMLEQCLGAILDATVEVRPQDESAATYCARRVPDDGRVDWSWPARRIHDFVRAQTRPYPGAFTDREDGRRVRIWRTAEIDGRLEILEEEVE